MYALMIELAKRVLLHLDNSHWRTTRGTYAG